MIVCRTCGYFYDSGDLVNGVCDDCRNEEKERERRTSAIFKMINGKCEQIELNIGKEK